jgi:hypothetical protein
VTAGLAEMLPPAAAFVNPYCTVALWQSPQRMSNAPGVDVTARQGSLNSFKDAVRGIASDWRKLADMRVEKSSWKMITSKTSDHDVSTGLELLRSVRHLYEQLSEGEATRRIEQDVKRLWPEYLPQLLQVKSEAIAQLGELRALFAFLFGEDDDLQLGFELVPNVDENAPAEDCSKNLF